MPFDMTLPKYNEEKLAAMREAREIASGKVKNEVLLFRQGDDCGIRLR